MGFVGDNGEYTGFDLDLAKEVASRLGLEYKAQPIAWTQDMNLIRQHRLYLGTDLRLQAARMIILDYTVYGKQAGIRCSERFRYQESG